MRGMKNANNYQKNKRCRKTYFIAACPGSVGGLQLSKLKATHFPPETEQQ